MNVSVAINTNTYIDVLGVRNSSMMGENLEDMSRELITISKDNDSFYTLFSIKLIKEDHGQRLMWILYFFDGKFGY